MQIVTQLNAAEIEIAGLRQQEATLQTKVRDLEALVMRGPEVERAYLDLQRNYQNVVSSYQDVVAKRRAAELGEALESESKSGTLSLIEPPSLPDIPIKPPRLILALASICLAVAGSGSMVWFLEIMDPTVRGARQLYALVGKGIAPHTIGAACSFIAGPCSCQVKGQNPGFDLLMSVDWDNAVGDNKISSPIPGTSAAPVLLKIPPGKSTR